MPPLDTESSTIHAISWDITILEHTGSLALVPLSPDMASSRTRRASLQASGLHAVEDLLPLLPLRHRPVDVFGQVLQMCARFVLAILPGHPVDAESLGT